MNRRQISILRTLLSIKEFITGNSLAGIYSVSNKTIYKDIDCINEALKEIDVSISKIPRKGMLITTNDSQRKKVSKYLLAYESELLPEKYSPHDRLKYIIKNLLITAKELNIFDIGEELFVSEASINRDLDTLEKLLKNYKLELYKQSSNVQIIGFERNKRRFLREFISSKILKQGSVDNKENVSIYLADMFSIEDLNSTQDVIQSISKKYKHVFSDHYYYSILLDTLINITRIRLGEHLQTFDNSVIKDLTHMEAYFFAEDLLTQCFNIAVNDIPSTELETMSHSLLAAGFKVNKSDVEKHFMTSAEKLIQSVSSFLSLDLQSDHHLKRALANHIGPMVFRLRNNTIINNPMIDEIKNQYNALFTVTWFASSELEEDFRILMTDAEIAFLVIHFQIALEKIQKPLKILVVCPTGLATSELILNKLKRIISQIDTVDKIDFPELEQRDIGNIDFIISSVDIPNLNKPFVKVSPIITENEMATIRKQYAKLSSSQAHVYRSVQNEVPFSRLLLGQLTDSSILIKENCITKEDCIDKLIEHSYPQNRNNIFFRKSVINREKLGSTSVHTGVALPHCDPKFVAKSQIVMMSLKKPIIWGQNTVSVVFLISLAEKDLSKLKSVLLSLLKRVENESFIKRLASAKNSEEFINVILDDK